MRRSKYCKNKKARHTRRIMHPVQRATAVAEGDSQAFDRNLRQSFRLKSLSLSHLTAST